MIIAVDAMGGDHAPQAVVAGAVEAAQRFPSIDKIMLVGDEERLRTELGQVPEQVEVFHAAEVIGMDEAPATALRRKRDSSVGRAAELVKNGDAHAMFSAGNTGAAVAAAKLRLRALEGVVRPAITTVMPTAGNNPCVMLDAGANPDSTAPMLAQFAVMGRVYAQQILGIAEPRVGLLSIGEEDGKGNEITKEAFKLLDKADMNFVGNIESRDLFEGKVDVVSCDGFVGNVVLKTSEAVASVMKTWLRSTMTSNPLRKMGAALLRGAFVELKEKADPESHGGAPLLGCNGICVIGHGSSSPNAVCNGIGVAAEAITHDINHLIIEGVKALGETTA